MKKFLIIFFSLLCCTASISLYAKTPTHKDPARIFVIKSKHFTLSKVSTTKTDTTYRACHVDNKYNCQSIIQSSRDPYTFRRAKYDQGLSGSDSMTEQEREERIRGSIQPQNGTGFRGYATNKDGTYYGALTSSERAQYHYLKVGKKYLYISAHDRPTDPGDLKLCGDPKKGGLSAEACNKLDRSYDNRVEHYISIPKKK